MDQKISLTKNYSNKSNFSMKSANLRHSGSGTLKNGSTKLKQLQSSTQIETGGLQSKSSPNTRLLLSKVKFSLGKKSPSNQTESQNSPLKTTHRTTTASSSKKPPTVLQLQKRKTSVVKLDLSEHIKTQKQASTTTVSEGPVKQLGNPISDGPSGGVKLPAPTHQRKPSNRYDPADQRESTLVD